MKTKFAAAFLAPAALLAASSFAQAADLRTYQEPDDRDGVKIGTLSCDIGGGAGYVLGSAKELNCVFHSSIGARTTESYTGTIRKMGVDLGFTTQGKLVWAVCAPTAGYHRGSLAGLYKGVTAEATVGAGVGANVLVGGTSGSIQLQTISVTGQYGLNIAATGTSVTLNPS
ncbi:DUF992 domain-containing protein [Mesorhizobium sp. ASY16-5R]|uniref:DUF992 domain-containing protein n=1 Tax=Mesorhizobium sp. ASY16-5R TaxID=3445772 RepID=UPI003FA06C9D